MKKPKIYMVVAVDRNFGIGKDKSIPWKLPKEIRYFKDLTTKTDDPDKKNMVIMGRTTWESIPENFRPLKYRENVILTRNPDYELIDAHVAASFEDALKYVKDNIENIYIIGGATVYSDLIYNEKINGIYLTKIDREYDCDTFFPEIPETYKNIQRLGKDTDEGTDFEYYLYEKE